MSTQRFELGTSVFHKSSSKVRMVVVERSNTEPVTYACRYWSRRNTSPLRTVLPEYELVQVPDSNPYIQFSDLKLGDKVQDRFGAGLSMVVAQIIGHNINCRLWDEDIEEFITLAFFNYELQKA